MRNVMFAFIIVIIGVMGIYSSDDPQIGLSFLQIAIWTSLFFHLSSDLDPCTRFSI